MIDLVLAELPNDALDHPKMYFGLGNLYIAGAAQRAGFEVTICDFREKIGELPDAKFYGFSATTPQIIYAKELAEKVDGMTIIGGPHASLFPDDCLGDFDYIVKGEGEEVLIHIMLGLINPGVVIASRIDDLNKLALPAWDLVDEPFSKTMYSGERYGEGELSVNIITSRGCPYDCYFCLPTNTKILTADLKWVNIQDVKVSDRIIGVEKFNKRLHYVPSRVIDTFAREAEVWAIETNDGTVYSTKDHPWLMSEKYKSINDIEEHIKYNASFTSERAVLRRMSIPCQDIEETDDYMIGYLSGAIAGDGCLTERTHKRNYGKGEYTYRRLQLVGDEEMLDAALDYADKLGLPLHERKFNGGEMYKNCTRAVVCDISQIAEGLFQIINRPNTTPEYIRGYLGGIYDAEGSYSTSILRIAGNDLRLKKCVAEYLNHYGFSSVIEDKAIRLLGGFSEQIRFLSLVQPKVVHKKNDWVGRQVHCSSRIKRVYRVGNRKVYNLKTSTENFIADGFITHNCGNVFRKPVVYRSVLSIIDEIQELQERGVRYYRFVDDNFTLHSQFDSLCVNLGAIGAHYRCHTRSNLITANKARWLKVSGCDECSLGIESADDKVLKLSGKNETVALHKKASRIIQDAGLKLKAYWMSGLPGETDETLELNKEFVREIHPDKWTLSTFVPYPGCEMYNHPEKFGIRILKNDWSKWWNFASGFNHILNGQTTEQMWKRYADFYDFLIKEG